MAITATRWLKVEDRQSDFDRLFLTEYERVVRIAHRIVRQLDEAEDVAQEVFCDFYRTHAAGALYAPAWLHRAAAHTALNHIRSQKRREQREKTHITDSQRLQGSFEGALDPQSSAEARETSEEVRAALSSLTARSASVLALRYGGLSYSEVAQALHVNVSQVGTLLRRAEAALRREMNHVTFE